MAWKPLAAFATSHSSWNSVFHGTASIRNEPTAALIRKASMLSGTAAVPSVVTPPRTTAIA